MRQSREGFHPRTPDRREGRSAQASPRALAAGFGSRPIAHRLPRPRSWSSDESVYGCCSGAPTRHEPKTRRTSPLPLARANAGSRTIVLGLRPDNLIVQRNRVRRRGFRLETFYENKRIVVAFDVERVRAMSEDGDLAGLRCLDPDRRCGRPYVTEKWTDEHVGGAGRLKVPRIHDLARGWRKDDACEDLTFKG
jgi:hypothetical protein